MSPLQRVTRYNVAYLPAASSSIPHTVPTPLPTSSLATVINNRNLFTRTMRSHTDSLPSKPFQHYNDIDSISLLAALNTIHTITPSTTPDPCNSHTSLLNDCFLSAPLPFLHNRSWDLTKPPNSYVYHKALNRLDNPIWFTAMQREYDSLESRRAFKRMTLSPGQKAIGVHWTFDYKYNPDGSIIRGKEKVCLVAQGFSQQLMPLVKLSSV